MEKIPCCFKLFFFQTVSLCYLLVALPSSESTVMGTQPRLTQQEEPFTLCSVAFFKFTISAPH